MAISEGVVIRPVRQSEATDVLQLLGQLWPEKHVDEPAIGATIGRYVREPQYWIYGYSRLAYQFRKILT